MAVGCSFSVPAVHALCQIVELGKVIVVPCTEDLVSALSHHIDTKRPVLVIHAERETVSDIRCRITYHGTVCGSDLSVVIDIGEFQVTGSNCSKCILRGRFDIVFRLIDSRYLIAIEVSDRITCHCVTLLFISGNDGITVLNKAFYFILDCGKVGTDGISPFADLVAPGDCHFHTFILNLSQVTDTGHCSGDSGNFSKQIFSVLHIIHTFEMQAVAKHIRFKSGFPCLYFFPAEGRIRQIGKLISRINDGRLTEYSRIGIGQ